MVLSVPLFSLAHLISIAIFFRSHKVRTFFVMQAGEFCNGIGASITFVPNADWRFLLLYSYGRSVCSTVKLKFNFYNVSEKNDCCKRCKGFFIILIKNKASHLTLATFASDPKASLHR